MFVKKSVFSNTLSGVVSNVLQNVFLGIFFVLLAKSIGLNEFSNYAIGNTLYQIVGVFSTMGLGTYFIREYVKEVETAKYSTIHFFSVEAILSLFALVVIYLLSISMYSDDIQIIQISSILGLNVLFDNLIYSIKAIHTAERTQYLILRITLIESLIKLLMVIVFYFMPFNFLLFLFLLVGFRVITLVLSYKSLPLHVKSEFGELKSYVNIKRIIKVKQIRALIYEGRVFVIIGSINVIFWRINALLLSKLTDKTDVGNYEVAFKLFSIAQIIPVILMGTIYPILAKNYSDKHAFLVTSKKAYLQMLIFSVYITLTAYYLSPYAITWFFGEEFKDSIIITQHMFLALIPFSLSLVQAYILIASHYEKIDMWLNIINLIVNSTLGYLMIKSYGLVGSVYSISISFLLFYVLQSVFMIKSKIDYLSKEKFKILVVILIPLSAFILSEGKYLTQLNDMILYCITLTILTMVVIVFKFLNKRILIKN